MKFLSLLHERGCANIADGYLDSNTGYLDAKPRRRKNSKTPKFKRSISRGSDGLPPLVELFAFAGTE